MDRVEVTQYYVINNTWRASNMHITQDLPNVRNTMEAHGKHIYLTNIIFVDNNVDITKRG